MDITNIFNSAAALIFVLCLIGLTSLVIRKINEKTQKQGIVDGNRIKILETKKLDAKNKIVLLQKDEEEHLILLSGDGNIDLRKKDKGQNKNKK